jgi:hypothetical protein
LAFVEQVLIPKGRYKGQKLTKLVRINTPARISRIKPIVPVMRFVKYSTRITAAITKRMVRSAVPMFFFIVNDFGLI